MNATGLLIIAICSSILGSICFICGAIVEIRRMRRGEHDK